MRNRRRRAALRPLGAVKNIERLASLELEARWRSGWRASKIGGMGPSQGAPNGSSTFRQVEALGTCSARFPAASSSRRPRSTIAAPSIWRASIRSPTSTLQHGADGFVVLGVSGEGPRLAPQEALDVASRFIARTGGKSVIVGVSNPSSAVTGFRVIALAARSDHIRAGSRASDFGTGIRGKSRLSSLPI
jgi:hypothetical protein